MTTHCPSEGGACLRQSLVDRIDMSGDCWIWTGRLDRHGYGRPGNGKLAHRVVYEALVGQIPAGLQLDHLCRVRHCVNPAHLEPVTNAENQRRGAPANKTHCKQGHPFDERNTYHRPNGGRTCRKCQTAATVAYQQRRAA